MKTKKTIIISALLLILISFGGYMVYQNLIKSDIEKVSVKPEEISVEAKTEWISSEAELTNKSDLIVIGELNKRGESEVDRSAEGNILNVYRMSDFKVSQVIKNTVNDTINENTIIPIYENEGYDQETNTIYHIAGYEKMEKNETYILFLKYYKDNKYYIPLGVNIGKINIDSNKKTELYGDENKEMEEEINELQSDAVDTYKDEIKEAENQ
ncbi:hypothetical protein OPJ22_002729 [Listeria innocua]|uniref:hypothetical protein n=1 Tax=Listeria innocua TaxID=1642 RepID=UPI000F255A69|nr:hypothetical protein [Listeria innocua]EFS5538983.1 hypothetical protein [Listeria monocytogenes]EAD5869306.1 hypothetical protein [Listeria innocua]EDO1175378.1 hypothetical protein [Listeria innocua]EHF3602251.1 hypothetical protein [Listeria innocua]EHF3616999.1 hypothetical protein [Listeria innocua]